MSIDYDSLYGIGFKVTESEEISDLDEMADGLLEYLECEMDSDIVDCFQPGNSFSGDEGPVFLVLKDPFKDGADLTNAKAILEAEADMLKVNIVSDFGLFGGIRVH